MEVSALAARVTADTQNFESGIARAGNQWAGFVKDVTGGAASLSSTLTRGFTMGIGFAGGLAGLRGLGDVFSSAQDAVIGFNSQLQKSSITFTAFAGSVQLSQQFLGQLKELAATSPFEFQDVLTGAQRFAGMGLAMDKIIPIMKDVSVVAQAMGVGAAQINSINLAISQVVARGKVSAQEMNQLANAGIPAWTILAGAMNKTVGEVMKLAEAGEISAADFLNAFDKAAHDPKLQALGEAMNKSFDTAASNVHDRVQFLVADIGKPIFDMATDIANGLANALNTPVIQGLGQAVGSMVQDMVDALRPLGDAFNAAFAKLQTGDLQGALGGMLDSINGFAREMFGAGYTLVTTMANGMLSGLGSVVSAAADIASTIAGFLIGNSPPPMGPLKEIEAGGTNLMTTYVGGMKGGLGELNAVTQGVADAFGNVNKEMTLDQGRAGLQAAAGNAAALKTEAADAAGVIQNLDGLMHEIERSTQAAKFAADDLKSSYEDQITALQDAADAILHQNDLLDKQMDIADRLKDAELKRAELAASGDPVQRAKLQSQIDANNEKLKEMRLAQSEADLEKQIAEARKNKKDTGPLQARLAELQIQKQNAALEKQQAGLVDKTGLAQIKQQQAIQKEQEDRRKTEQDIRKLQAEQAAAPLLAQVQALKKEEAARLKPLEDQLKVLDRQRAVIQAQRQDWQELKQDIAAANALIEKTKKTAAGADGAASGGGLAGLKITSQPIAAVNQAAENLAKNFGEKFKASIDGWFKAHGGELQGGIAGALIGGVAFGPLGALVGGMFGQALVKSLQEKFPDIGKLVQEKLGVAAFAVEAFGKILQGQDVYIIPFQEALKNIVPAPFQGMVSGAGQAVATLRDAVVTTVQVFQGQWSPGISAASSGIDPFVRNVGLAAMWLKDTFVPAVVAVATALGGAFMTAVQWVANTGWPGIVAAGERVRTSLGQIRDFVQQVYDKMVDNGAIATFQAAFDGAGKIVDQVNGFLKTFQTDLDGASGAVDRARDPVDNTALAFKGLADKILSITTGVSDFLTTMKQIEDALNAVQKSVNGAGLAMHTLVDDGSKFLSFFESLGGPLGAIATILERIGTAIDHLPKSLPSWMTGSDVYPFRPPGQRVVPRDQQPGMIRTSYNPGQSGTQGIYGDAGPITAEALSIMRTGQSDSIEQYIRQAASLRNIDQNIAVLVAKSEGGLMDPTRQSDIVYGGQREQSYGPFQLNINGGLGATAMAQGIDPRNEAQWKQAVDFALDQVAKGGWEPFHGAAASGIGNWDGVGSPGAAAGAAVMASLSAPKPATRTQFQLVDQGLTADAAASFCGPYAAMLFANAVGRYPTAAEAQQLATKVGWTPGAGMAGIQSELALMQSMGLNVVQQAGTPSNINAALGAGHPIAISTPQHYFEATGGTAEGGLDVGATGTALKGGKAVMTLAEIEALSGPLQGIIVLQDQLNVSQSAGTQAAAGQAAAQAGLAQVIGGAVAPTAALVTAQKDGGAWAQEMARQQEFLNGVLQKQAPSTTTAVEALLTMSKAIGPVERQVAGTAISGDTLRFKLLELASATGLNTKAFEDLNKGMDSSSAMDELIRASAALGPDFQAIAQYLDTAGSSSNEAAVRYLNAVKAYTEAQKVAAGAAATAPPVVAAPTAPGQTVAALTAPIDAQKASFDALKPSIDAASTSTTSYQAAIASLDPTKINDQMMAWGSATDALKKFDDAAHSLADFLDDHVFHVQIKVDDYPDEFKPGSPTPFEMGLRGIADAAGGLNRIHPPTMRTIAEPTLASVGGRGGGGTVTENTYVTVQVTGSVVSEGQLIDRVHQGLLKKKRTNRRLGLGDND